MITQHEVDDLCHRRIAYLRWEFWRYSFARTLCLSGQEVDGRQLCLLFYFTDYIDLPVNMKNPIFSLTSEDELHAMHERFPGLAKYRTDSLGIFKIMVDRETYHLWVNKLVIIDETENPALSEFIASEIALLEQTHIPYGA